MGAIMTRTIVEAEGIGYGIWNRELTESEIDELMALIPLGARRRITVMDDLNMINWDGNKTITVSNSTYTSDSTGGTNIPWNGDSINIPGTSYPYTQPYPNITTTPIYTIPSIMIGGSGIVIMRTRREFVPSEGPSKWQIIDKGKLRV